MHAHPTRTLLILLAGLLVVVGLVYALHLSFSGTAQTSEQSALTESVAAFNQNDFTGALSSVDSILVSDPNNVAALLAKASILAQEGSLGFQEQVYGPQAIAVAQHVLAIDPNNSDAWRIIGYANEITQNYTAAHQAYAKSLALNPKNALTVSQEAHAYDLQGDLTKAEAGYRAALAIDPHLELALMGLGRVLYGSGNLDGALAQFEQVLPLTQNVHTRAEADYTMGIIESMKGNAELAQQNLTAATAADPQYPLAWAGLGAVLFTKSYATSSSLSVAERTSLVTQSLQYLAGAIKLNLHQSSAYLQLGVELAAIGRKTDALKVLNNGSAEVARDITLSATDKKAMFDSFQTLIKDVQNKK